MIAAVMMVRDEADLISTNIRHLIAQGVDRVIVADNLSTDGTHAILEAAAESLPVTVVYDDDPAYYQSAKMSHLADLAGEMGADWCLPVDADEIWFSPFGTLAQVLNASTAAVEMAQAWEMIPQPDDDLAQPSPLLRIRHQAAHPKRMRKVAFRYQPGAVVAQGNHDVDLPGSRHDGSLCIHEYQYRSLDHLRRKVRNGKAAYDATDLFPSEGEHWRRLGALDDGELEAWWEQYQRTPVAALVPA